MSKNLVVSAIVAALIATPAMAIDANNNQSWSEILKTATTFSAQQNNGKPAYFRQCFPEEKYCTTQLSYIDKKGLIVTLHEFSNLDELVVKRDVCWLNGNGDIRICTDWDSNESTKEMKDNANRWTILRKGGPEMHAELDRMTPYLEPKAETKNPNNNAGYAIKPGVAY